MVLTLLEFIGFGACHQRFSLSFNYMQEYMPVCSRCTGIYIGFLLSSFIILLFERKIRTQLPGKKIIITIAILFTAMAAESGLSFLKIIPSYNQARFLTGYSVSWFLPLLLIPLLNSVVFKPEICLKEQYLNKAGHFIIWVFTGVAAGLIFFITYKQLILFWSIASIAGLILFVAALAMILVFASVQKLRSTIRKPLKFLGFFLIAITISLAFISMSSYLKSAINPHLSSAFEHLKSLFSR